MGAQIRGDGSARERRGSVPGTRGSLESERPPRSLTLPALPPGPSSKGRAPRVRLVRRTGALAALPDGGCARGTFPWSIEGNRFSCGGATASFTAPGLSGGDSLATRLQHNILVRGWRHIECKNPSPASATPLQVNLGAVARTGLAGPRRRWLVGACWALRSVFTGLSKQPVRRLAWPAWGKVGEIAREKGFPARQGGTIVESPGHSSAPSLSLSAAAAAPEHGPHRVVRFDPARQVRRYCAREKVLLNVPIRLANMRKGRQLPQPPPGGSAHAGIASAGLGRARFGCWLAP